MRVMRFGLLIGLAAVLWTGNARAEWPSWLAAPSAPAWWPHWNPSTNIKGNDTGGILFWSPENEQVAQQLTDEFCARWHKYARLSSIHRQIGDTIAFNCLWSPTIGPYILPRAHVAGERPYRRHVTRHREEPMEDAN